MGLSLTQPDPNLKQAYAEWTAEVKKAIADERAGTAPTPVPPQPPQAPIQPTFKPAPPDLPPPAPKKPEPPGPVLRRLESPQGQA